MCTTHSPGRVNNPQYRGKGPQQIEDKIQFFFSYQLVLSPWMNHFNLCASVSLSFQRKYLLQKKIVRMRWENIDESTLQQSKHYFISFKIINRCWWKSCLEMVPIYLERNSKRIRKANNDAQLKFTFTTLPPQSWICGAKLPWADVGSQVQFLPSSGCSMTSVSHW